MTEFMNDDFLLSTKTSKELYHDFAEEMPIADFHNHLNPQEICEDASFGTITDIWLGADHYKWRAMRANGIPEHLITGDGDPYEKFIAWADTVQNAIGNPLYHWTHLELKRYFGINTVLTPDSAREIWERCNEKLASPGYSARSLLRMQNVRVLCTTDDPADDLCWHKKLKENGFEIQVLPTFRPEKALGIEKQDFAAYIENLGRVTGKMPESLEELINGLKQRLEYFTEAGCRVSDHSLESTFYLPSTYEEADQIYRKKLEEKQLTEEECTKYRGFILTELGKEYAQKNLVMQLHIGALRNNSTRMFRKLGPDSGLDSLNDFNYAAQLSALLDAMDREDKLPKTVLYYLNPKDAEMLAAMAGDFQSNSRGIRGKVQLGSAWWFCDHKNGMENQMKALSDVGLISSFIGMLTDSRSFLSFPRHEYFRRILCNYIGTIVDNGEYPHDRRVLGKLIKDICYDNAVRYFRF